MILPEPVRGISVDDVDHLRDLVGRQTRAAVREQRVDVEFALPGDHEQVWHLAQRRMRHADHRAVDHLRMEKGDFLDFGRRDVLPAADDQLLDASGDGEIAVRIGLREIAGVIPALAQRRRRFLRLVVIALHQVGAANDQLALGADRQILQRGRIDDPVARPGTGRPQDPMTRVPVVQFIVTIVEVSVMP